MWFVILLAASVVVFVAVILWLRTDLVALTLRPVTTWRLLRDPRRGG